MTEGLTGKLCVQQCWPPYALLGAHQTPAAVERPPACWALSRHRSSLTEMCSPTEAV